MTDEPPDALPSTIGRPILAPGEGEALVKSSRIAVRNLRLEVHEKYTKVQVANMQAPLQNNVKQLTKKSIFRKMLHL